MKNKKKLWTWLGLFGSSLLSIGLYVIVNIQIVQMEGESWNLDADTDSFGMLLGSSLVVAFFLLLFTVFLHGLLGFLGKQAINEIDFHVLRAIRRDKRNRWVLVWSIFPAIPTVLFLWEGIAERLVSEVFLGLMAAVYTYLYMVWLVSFEKKAK